MSDLHGKRPKLLGARAAGLRLTPEERAVIARVDGNLSVGDLVAMTGLEPTRLEQIVAKLASEGALDLGAPPPAPSLPAAVDDGGTTSLSDFAAALGMDPTSFKGEKSEAAPPPATALAADASAESLEAPTIAEGEEPMASDEAPDASTFGDERLDEGEASEAEAAEEDEVGRAVAERNYRQVYEQRWHPLPADQRAGAARAVSGVDLLALCFDPEPQVIGAILENASIGLDHVRLIALHHRTGTGLELVARRQDWLRDLLVERRLLRNPMIGDIVLGRVVGPKRLLPTYKIAIDRDVPELTRVKCRGLVRKKWQTATSEERADLLVRTEARCLLLMTGCTFDAKTTAILCGRPINSIMFVQSVAKFSASPPALLAHLVKQPFVRKNAPIKKLLLAHPNMPGDVKRTI